MFRYVVIFGLLSLGCSAYSHPKLEVPLVPECVQQSGVTRDDYESIDTIDGLYLLMQGRQMDYVLCLARKQNLITGEHYLQPELRVDNFKKAIQNSKRMFDQKFLEDVEVCSTVDGLNALICLLFRLKSWVEKNYKSLERRKERYDRYFGTDPNATTDATEHQTGKDGLSRYDIEDIIWHTMNMFHGIVNGMEEQLSSSPAHV